MMLINFKINLFNDLIEGYFRIGQNDYSNKIINNNKFLQKIDSKIFGLTSNYDNANLGLEFENNKLKYMKDKDEMCRKKVEIEKFDLQSEWEMKFLTEKKQSKPQFKWQKKMI